MDNRDKNKTKEDYVAELVAMDYYCFNLECLDCDELEHCKDDQLHVNMVWRLLRYGKITREDGHRELGKYFKYPQCCIDNFVRLNKIGECAGVYMNETHGESKNDCKHVECVKCRTKKGKINEETKTKKDREDYKWTY